MPVEVRPFRACRLISPWKEAAASRRIPRINRRRDLPFCFSGKSPAGPPAVSVRFIPAYVYDGKILGERNIAIEDARQPSTGRFFVPVHWMLKSWLSFLDRRIQVFVEEFFERLV